MLNLLFFKFQNSSFTVDLNNNELELTDICDPWMLFHPHFDIDIQSDIDNIAIANLK